MRFYTVHTRDHVILSIRIRRWSQYHKALLAAAITIAAFAAWVGLVMTDLPDTPTNIQTNPMSATTPIDRGEQN